MYQSMEKVLVFFLPVLVGDTGEGSIDNLYDGLYIIRF